MWSTESLSECQCSREISRRDEALEGEITTLLGSAVLTAAIPTSHQSFFRVYLAR